MDWNRLERIIEDNETYVGSDPDREKLARLETMRALAEQIAQKEPRISARPLPVVNVHRHAGVRLELPAVMFTANKDAIHTLGELFRLCDAVTFSAVGDDGGLRITCDVQDIWNAVSRRTGAYLWRVRAAHRDKPAFVCRFTVRADSEADARAAAEATLPEGFHLTYIGMDGPGGGADTGADSTGDAPGGGD